MYNNVLTQLIFCSVAVLRNLAFQSNASRRQILEKNGVDALMKVWYNSDVFLVPRHGFVHESYVRIIIIFCVFFSLSLFQTVKFVSKLSERFLIWVSTLKQEHELDFWAALISYWVRTQQLELIFYWSEITSGGSIN